MMNDDSDNSDISITPTSFLQKYDCSKDALDA